MASFLAGMFRRRASAAPVVPAQPEPEVVTPMVQAERERAARAARRQEAAMRHKQAQAAARREAEAQEAVWREERGRRSQEEIRESVESLGWWWPTDSPASRGRPRDDSRDPVTAFVERVREWIR